MIIKKLQLENVRSYKDEVIEFPLGKTLFEGDIGSGKSTILMAIEFALFGLGDQKPGGLLKAGEQEAKVGLALDIGGREYSVLRGLEKKGRSIQQTDGVLKTPEGVMNLSPGELKEKVLEILSFNEPSDPKAQSVIYRYAVFTPQEEMKEILILKSELRVQTLRKAFGLEDYKTAIENAQNVSGEIGDKVERLEGAALDIELLKKKVQDLSKETDDKRKELSELNRKKAAAKELLDRLEADETKLRSEESRLTEATGKVSVLAESLEQENRDIGEDRQEVEELTKKVAGLAPRMVELKKVESQTAKSQDEIQEDIDKHDELEKKALKLENQLEQKLEDYRSVEESGICPTCDTKVNPKLFQKRMTTKVEQKKEASERVEQIRKHVRELKELLRRKRTYDEAQKELESLRERTADDTGKKEKLQKRINAAEDEADGMQKKLDAAKGDLKLLKVVQDQLEILGRRKKEVNSSFVGFSTDASKAEQAIKDKQNEAEGYSNQVKRKENYKRNAEVLSEHQIWIDDYFIPAMGAIEKQVFANINQDFDAQFQKWFAMLVEDPGKDAYVDENFTPIVEQDGYEQDVRYLSGGERTSVALAYRLALNSIVQKVSVGMRSNLLILDEPTDGFSKEQLGKVREILDELQCPQVIIVSHERELEGFADQIFRVEKLNGISKVTGVAR